MKDKIIFTNAAIYTMDPQVPRADCVVIDNGRITAVGETAILTRWVDDTYENIDLGGRLVIPGLTDSHTHFAMYSLGLEKVSLEGTQHVKEALARLQEKASSLPAGEWVLGVNWDKNVWPGGKAPTKEDADNILPKHPLAVVSKCGHLTWANSLALKQAGVNKETPDPEGGEIQRYEGSQEPTGILKENAAALVREIIPTPTEEQYVKAIKKGMNLAHSLGLVGIHNCEDSHAFKAFQAIHNQGDLPLRVHHHLAMANLDNAVELGLKSGFGTPTLNIGSLKLFSDGALGSQTASMLEPFEGSEDDYGIVVHTKEELSVMIKKAARAGISSAVHAIGDRANQEVLDIFAECQNISNQKGLRQRIEHAQLIAPEDFSRFAELEVIASVQPLHATSDRRIVDKHWGQRGRQAYAFKTFLDNGVKSAYGSDVPVETLDPVKGIFAAVTRRREDDQTSPPWYPQQCLSVEEAVHGYTVGAAYAAYQEENLGSLAVGKAADMVVLSRDIFAIPADEILSAEVDFTIVDGKVVFARD